MLEFHKASTHCSKACAFFFFFFFPKGMWQCLTRTMFTNGTGLFENVGVHGRNFLACKRTKAENGQRTNIHPAQRAVGHSIGMQDTSPNKILRSCGSVRHAFSKNIVSRLMKQRGKSTSTKLSGEHTQDGLAANVRMRT
ncbi:hypothetical protein IscW_ISCW020840 [Ixodes scapularis]|uniref:Uncharacterized protein n=1 Tax=Ixodes scapularis TaxID=6945 RepID=B7Q2A1_IXOSC|nr:hypothetical protein IscW_ISCW020840 [Ixodes scapularis]|eukprot:XP_002410618.1 hypothetical protein IscW_ISCW020840 [Ixodes scapularis]